MKNFLLFALCCIFITCQTESDTGQTEDNTEMTTDEVLQTLGQIYVYGYPLILSDLTKKTITSVDRPDADRPLAPVNQLGHYRKFPDSKTRAVVKPNVDTYYTISWFDLNEEPQLLTMPATERYYLLQFLDAYSNVFGSLGPRTTGTGAQQFLIAGPDWKGTVPDSMTVVQSPTNMAWLLGRIQVNSPQDGATVVKAIQDQMHLQPLSTVGTDYTPPLGENRSEDQKATPANQIQKLGINDYLNELSRLLAENPPPAADSLMLKKMESVGLVPGQPFKLTSDNLVLKLKMKAIPSVAHQRFNDRRTNPSPDNMVNNWMYVTTPIGDYGTDYKFRAYIGYIGFGANLPQDAVYPNTTLDSEGRTLDGKYKYQIHFAADQLPPVNAFWSLTAYDAEEFLIDNEIDRYALGDRDDIKYNADGSLDIYIQNERPTADKTSNWLPTVDDGKFYLTFRLYWPKEEVLNKEWDIPMVKRVEE